MVLKKGALHMSDISMRKRLRYCGFWRRAGTQTRENNVGRMYSLGQGVTKDEGEAMKWMTLSAGSGNLEAQEALAVLAIMEFYEKRQGVENKEEKIQWIISSARRGNPEAMNALGMLYSSGNGLPMTTIEADKWSLPGHKERTPTGREKPRAHDGRHPLLFGKSEKTW